MYTVYQLSGVATEAVAATAVAACNLFWFLELSDDDVVGVDVVELFILTKGNLHINTYIRESFLELL